MNEDRAHIGIAHIAQHRQQMIEIMSVDRPDIVEAEFLEQRAAGHHAAGIFLGARRLIAVMKRGSCSANCLPISRSDR